MSSFKNEFSWSIWWHAENKRLWKKNYTPFLLITLILCLSFSIRSGFCEELQNNKALDEKVRMFLENRKGTWHDWNIPYSDGKILYDLVLKNKYKKAIEIGTSTGLSAIWIACKYRIRGYQGAPGRCFVVDLWVHFCYLFIMPRQARIDAPGALQHIIIRAIEQRAIFKNDTDRDDFIDRPGNLIPETETVCYAWAFRTNHPP